MKILPPYPDYIITQRFGENASSFYAANRLVGHPAIDFESLKSIEEGAGEYIVAGAPGFVYKITNRENPDLTAYKGVFLICADLNGVFELSYGHFTEIFVAEGQWVAAGQALGIEGNTGDVFVNGQPVTLAERQTGKGRHCHMQKRIVERVTATEAGCYYLDTLAPSGQRQQTLYQDPAGNFYKVPSYANGYNGCVDFEVQLYRPKPFEWIQIWGKVFEALLATIKGRKQ